MEFMNGSEANGRAACVEALVRALAGVLSARVRLGPAGELLEVHVTAAPDAQPWQIARDIQSALYARLGVALDAGRIVIETAPRPPAADYAHALGNGGPPPPTSATPTAPITDQAPPRLETRILGRPDPRPRLEELELHRLHPHRVRCRLVLALEDRRFPSEAEVLDGPGAPAEAAARAALSAVRAVAGPAGAALQLEGVRCVEVGGQEFVLAAVRTLHGRLPHSLAGAAPVTQSPEYAAALATLHATNRWLGAQLWNAALPRGL